MSQQIINNGDLLSVVRANMNSNFTELYNKDVNSDSVYTTTNNLSSNWSSNYTTTKDMSAKWSAMLPLSGGDLTGSVTLSTFSSSDAFRITQSGTGNAFVVEDTTNPDSTPFVITADGNVGVGTSSPINNANSSSVSINGGSNGGRIYLLKSATQYGVIYSANTNLFDIEGIGNNAIRFNTNLTNRMFIASAGNIGVGTMNPNATLTVVGGVSATGDFSVNTGSRLNFSTSSTSTSIRRNPSANGMEFFTTDTSRMFIADGGNVGIGTTNPIEKLTLNGAVNTNRLVQFSESNTAKGYVGLGADNILRFATTDTAQVRLNTNNLDRLNVDSAGNVGIGTLSPSTKLQVEGAVKLGRNDTSLEGGQINFCRSIDNASAFYIDAYGNTNTPSFRIASLVGGGVALTIDGSNSNIGVGSAPYSKFSVYGGSTYGIVNVVAAIANNESSISFFDSGDADSDKWVVGKNIGNNATDSFSIARSGTEHVIVTTAGNVGIGTASTGNRLAINTAAAGIGGIAITQSTFGTLLMLPRSSVGNYNPLVQANDQAIIFSGGPQNSGTGLSIAPWSTSTTGMRITVAGNVGIGVASPSYQLQLSTDSAAKPATSAWTIASDERIKENIEEADLDICYNIVKNLPLKRYTWKENVYSLEQVKDRTKIGWIAQDVKEVFPKAVASHRLTYNQVYEDIITPELDNEGSPILDENGVEKTKIEKKLVSEDVIDDCLTLNSDQIYAALYGSVQKLVSIVEDQANTIAELSSRIETLEKK